MKKIYFAAVFTVLMSLGAVAQTVVRTTTTSNQQTVYRALPNGHDGLNVGASFMLPIADLSDYSSAGVALDINYLYPIAPMLNMGIASGYAVVFGDDYQGPIFEYEGEDFQYIPVSVATRYVPTEKVEFGADLGYAIGVSNGFDGGFYYRPVIAFNLTEMVQLNFSYTGVNNNNSWVTWSTLNFGVMFNLN
ncbi:conserved hypothetical protein [Formosa agariphila KMM 3901]|uniref:Outer membrane protein beta-barrel domain-containing protein n=1 Tax=Formosa agariphila (strain DSM 15362 / KCTC 12365 / LMG 23005 / KMM 3901 / M-2Alg 35-1) TaxID=1347342 RepID=T2KLY6_FORAG|nr:hypothetical protein [Formosa agariphila]CDF79441.1 conserved hypothetical protein [Formosa agariphila KMM 3901]